MFNHYRRIEPRISAPPDPPPPPPISAAPSPLEVQEPARLDESSFAADFEKANGIQDATRVVGAEDGSDPTLTHGALTREEKWGTSPNKAGEWTLTCEARGDGYFSSRRPPTLLGKAGRRARESEPAATTSNDDSKTEDRARKRKSEEERREARRLEEEARVRRAAELNEAMGQVPLPEELDVVVEKSNVLVVYVVSVQSNADLQWAYRNGQDIDGQDACTCSGCSVRVLRRYDVHSGRL